ncbi:Enoyl-CoA delta isomerase 2 [Phytophthora nicotianae]|uniref:Enoyl-CoA delta isomerase 2 n=1 Tax=Phytophthora nicotianae TaxID=4792 RepID=A0A0W8D1D3_PHYNI|nr:Enoyl-CoA delta isomerase 2 [Phytophthora nicotianae]
MVASTNSFYAMLAMTTLTASVNGHGYMTEPAVTFLSSSTDNTQFIATIESLTADNTAAFTTAFEASSYTSLKELINDLATITVTDATLTCGSCDPDETAQPLPETYVEWSHSSSEGFTSSHEGPCEVWCDDVRVFQDNDCAADYTSAPAELPYDRDACLGTSTLTFYWLALHSSTWQVYINCAPLESTTSTGATSKYAVAGSSSETTTATNSTSTTSTASSAAESSTASSSYNFNTNFATSTSASTSDETSSATTTAPTTTDTPVTTTTDTPVTTTTAPTATTDAPASTATPTATTATSKCSVRRRRD